MLTESGKNQLLDANDSTHAAAHSDYPGSTFANELSGGSPAYARKAITWAAAASGALGQSGSIDFDVTGTVAWITAATASSGGIQRALWPLGGASKEYDVDPSTDVFALIGHPYVDGDTVVFYGGSVPGGLAAGTIYYIRDKATDSFKVAATAGGAAIDITSRPSTGDAVMSIIQVNSGGQRTLTVSALTLHLNN